MATTETRPGLLEGKSILVMGLFTPKSFAWAIGEEARRQGADILYSVLDEPTIPRATRFFRNEGLELPSGLLTCDVTKDEDIESLVSNLENPLDGLVYSIAYTNPQTTMGRPSYKAPRADILDGFNASAIGLPMVVGGLMEANKLNPGASIVAMTFDSQRDYRNYGWMGPMKAALEASVKLLCAELAYKGIRVYALSSGPQNTMAASRIPGFKDIAESWTERAPLGWDIEEGRHYVAKHAAFFLSDYSQGATGNVHFVDGGFNVVGIPFPPYEQTSPEETTTENPPAS